MAPMRVFNSLGRESQPFTPRQGGRVGMYVCGPTVQSAPHVGHGRSAVAFDVIRRYLEWRGFLVTYVVNITDVEDKIIAKVRDHSKRSWRDEFELTLPVKTTLQSQPAIEE